MNEIKGLYNLKSLKIVTYIYYFELDFNYKGRTLSETIKIQK